ncbi:helix-turn-helix domain-containing protein [Nanoarchaeota archaeon]
MWIAKFKIWHKNCLIRPKCVKHQITDFVYLINSWTEKGKFYYTELHVLQGAEEDKKEFIKDLRKEKSIKKLEQKGNYIFTLNKEPLLKQYYAPNFDPKIIQVKPIAQRMDGYEDWEVASWNKDVLIKIMDVPVFKTELISIKNTKLSEIFMPHIFPKLPEKQRQAIELAVKHGYYEYPKKINFEKLAKITNVSRQTFQTNLRRAEKKLIPFLTESLN